MKLIDCEWLVELPAIVMALNRPEKQLVFLLRELNPFAKLAVLHRCIRRHTGFLAGIDHRAVPQLSKVIGGTRNRRRCVTPESRFFATRRPPHGTLGGTAEAHEYPFRLSHGSSHIKHHPNYEVNPPYAKPTQLGPPQGYTPSKSEDADWRGWRPASSTGETAPPMASRRPAGA